MAKVRSKTKSTSSSVNKKSTSSNKVKNGKSEIIRKEISGIFIIAFALFLIVVTKNTQTGIIGYSINKIIHSSFGLGANILPYVILLIGVRRLLNIVKINDENQIIAILGFFTCYTMYSALTDTTTYAMLTSKPTLSELFTFSAELGNYNYGGGILGNILTLICVKLVGKIGTVIVLATMLFTFAILITNQSVVSFFTAIINFIKRFFDGIYNFIFPETSDINLNDELKEKNNKQKNSRKNKKDKIDSQILDQNALTSVEENIKIYDYSNNDKTRSDITQLKIDDSQSQINKSINDTSLNVENNDLNLKELFEVKEVVEIKEEKKVKQKESKLEPFEKKEISDDIINTLSSTIQGKYKLPSSSLLENTPSNVKGERGEKEELRKDGEKLIETLNSFNIPCNILQINKGPTITRYEIQPAPGIKVSKITSLSNDLAMALATSQIRMEAPIPGKAAIGIEVANKIKSSVHLRSIVESKEYKSANTNIPFALGKDIAGKNIVASIDKMPHLLIAGATGSGKSVCINTLIMSILFRAKPDEVKLILIDPKVVELSIYNSVPHLLIPVVTDPRKAANALNWAVSEMTNRYKIFAANSVRDIFSYNERMVKENKEKMPQIVIIIDELADLMTVASSEVEEYITRIAQLARACGMHLVIATQRPSVDVITGVIKANIPSRIAFAVSSYIDSRTILDTAGAEKLLGKGDMLYHPMGMSKPIRIQGTFISDEEIKSVVDYIREQQIELKTPKSNDIMKEIEKNPEQPEDVDEFLEQAVEMVVNDGQASASYIQRKFKVGYSRAARIIDQLEDRGIVGGHEGSKPRKVLITKEELEEMRGNN